MQVKTCNFQHLSHNQSEELMRQSEKNIKNNKQFPTMANLRNLSYFGKSLEPLDFEHKLEYIQT